MGATPGGSDALTFSGNPNLDEDGDGLSAFLEYALGSVGGDSSASPESYITVDSGLFDNGLGTDEEYLTMTYRRNLAADDVFHSVQVATDPGRLEFDRHGLRLFRTQR